MKLIGELKDKVELAETKEEKKDIIAQAGMEPTNEELESVAGGRGVMTYLKCFGCNNEWSSLEGRPSNCPSCGFPNLTITRIQPF